ncbi:MAG: alpha-hydroxy-acid oxidizing protein [Kutzneria sp.]|nr:alpha-hydroxy-acid oxidizing protein [Kutzneria sp.]MBV9844277.1 alpha-hydroxy-acid oxidizing protein [Kutzneria sp.]
MDMSPSLPRWRDLLPLLRPRPIELSPVRRALARSHSIADLRRESLKRVPRAVFDYVDGGADEEISLRRNRNAFTRVEFTPSVLRGGQLDTTTTILGKPAELPLVLAPTGFTRMMHHAGEPAVARAAADAGLPYTLSTMGTTAPDALAAEVPGADLWFQLYVWRDRGLSKDLVDLVRQAGYRVLMLTVDTPVLGNRRRDLVHGLALPPRLGLRAFLDGAMHPSWWWKLLTTEPLRFAALTGDGSVGPVELGNTLFDPTISWDDVDWLRSQWSGPVVLKGIQSLADARRAADAGVEAIALSNHGGRQLDQAPAPLELLPAVADAVGDRLEVYVDSGVRTGADLAAAVALGARASLVGRAYLYGLMTGGGPGVVKAIDILRGELTRTLRLLGVNRVADLTSEHARLRGSA